MPCNSKCSFLILSYITLYLRHRRRLLVQKMRATKIGMPGVSTPDDISKISSTVPVDKVARRSMSRDGIAARASRHGTKSCSTWKWDD